MRRSGLSACLISVMLLAMSSPVFADISVLEDNFSNTKMIEPSHPLTIKFDHLPAPNEGNLVFFLGQHDITVLFTQTGPEELTYQTGIAPLPSGVNELIIYQVRGMEYWQELTRLPIHVLSPGEVEEKLITPSPDIAGDLPLDKGQRQDANAFEGKILPYFDLLEESQLNEGHSIDAPPPEHSTFNDLGTQTGFSTRHTRNDLELTSGFNFIGNSRRDAALRFSEKGTDAPKFDLSDYLLEVQKPGAKFSLGHINYGNHPLLLNDVDSRGLVVSYKINDFVDVSVNSMNGTLITGYENFFGLEDRDHNISAATLGVELFKKRPGELRLELMLLDASIRALNNFNAGEVTDAEESAGWGVRLSGSNESGRLRGDLSYARSSYDNPADPFLEQGLTLVDVEKTTNNARLLSLSYDLFRDIAISDDHTASLTANVSQERVDPLYKSLGAFSNSDQLTNNVSLDGRAGSVGVQLQYTENEDNLDNIPTILKIKTRVSHLGLNAALQSLLGKAENPSGWWPQLTYSITRVHQFADNDPGGFPPPDQMNVVHNAGLDWIGDKWSAGYTFSRSNTDNRQAGRVQADFTNYNNAIKLGLVPMDNLSFNIGVANVRAVDVEGGITVRNKSANLDLIWEFIPNWTVSGSYNKADDTDTLSLFEANNHTTQTQISWRFEVPGRGGRKLPGQFFLRHSLQYSKATDNAFNFSSLVQTWTVNSGLSISLF